MQSLKKFPFHALSEVPRNMSSKRGKEAKTEKTGNPEAGDARRERGQGVSGSHAPAPPEQEGREAPRTGWGICGAGRVERELVLRSWKPERVKKTGIKTERRAGKEKPR